jgi:hypothetical protein
MCPDTKGAGITGLAALIRFRTLASVIARNDVECVWGVAGV